MSFFLIHSCSVFNYLLKLFSSLSFISVVNSNCIEA